ncbi:amidohydrolase family protein [Robiginitalea sp. M366]|uniref:amidohydrolase family protein n=1 Tax=Robiginitalea aestuariiviva TaxID=3036903 RepID=UPI00240D30F0|nr:amidohydrolase family protein [Robiginitalea aestuariiviva]MDG1573233.1 amidohydrolase family protein [Robiginitalea aestuariiviva]
MKWKLAIPAILWLGAFAFGQEYYPKNDGVKAADENYTAFTNARIYVSPGQVIDNGTLLIRKGKVVAAGSSVRIPENTVTMDLEGKYIYPSFIDVFSDYGIEKPKRAPGGGRTAQYEATREGFYWNDHIRPEQQALEAYSFDQKAAQALRKLGFGVVNSHVTDGIARGTGVLLALQDEGAEGDRVLEGVSGQYFSFDKSVTSRQSYPTSLMGAMALLRQMYYDADWYARGGSATTDRSLEALLAQKNLVHFFAAGDKGNILRADGIGDAFGVQYVMLAGGQEYENIDQIKATGATLVVPLNFPEAFDVSNPYEAGYISLEDMKHWNQAPTNPGVLHQNGIAFAFTLQGLQKQTDFMPMLRKAIQYGLPEEEALRALTTEPARLLGQADQIGSLQTGRRANFLIASGPVFDENTTLYENWVNGQRDILADMDQKDIRGTYTLTAAGKTFTLELGGKAAAPSLKVKRDTTDLKGKIAYSGDWADLSFTDGDDRYRLAARVQRDADNLQAKTVLPDGKETRLTLKKTAAFEAEKEKEAKEDAAPEVLPLTYPNIGYGYAALPKQEDVLFRNATVWTSEDAGILENTDVLVRGGKIARIGKDLSPGRARVIDATGKHLTAGIIDEHSHIAALAINEAGHNSSAEVKISDVVDPEDPDIYRNLAGGVTSIQILHGSANPIGGRSAIIKLKWGQPASEMLYKDMPKYIKFALGENVKQSNWQSYSRFPQTRMGVEQVFLNYFQRAKEYQAKKDAGQPFRYDEEMEVLAEILRGERFISCHSYVQSEINMLMKVADKMGFRVNTFTHILEGYKVADKMAEHGVGGSTFSDWWAYKFEVNDAIPYNAAIMHNQGVTVAINSDDAEMSRRLNQEAAKTVKYGGMSEEEAWKMVTINPAKLLHLDQRTGSIKEGKDADLVLWSGNPLSVYSKAEKTYIEGVPYFDLETDTQIRSRMAQERNTLIDMMLDQKDGGNKRAPRMNRRERLHCNSL